MSLYAAHPQDRVQVFIDGQNLYGSARALGKKVNWKALMESFMEETRLIRANYFTTVRPQADDRFFKMLKFLEHNGYTVDTKEVRDNMDDAGVIRVRGTMVGEMTASMVLAAQQGTDHVILFTGDGELCAAVQACKHLDARVSVASMQGVASEELMRLADDFIPLDDFPAHIIEWDEKKWDDRKVSTLRAR